MTIAQELERPFAGNLGETSVVCVAVQTGQAKPGDRHAPEETGNRRNRFTGLPLSPA